MTLRTDVKQEPLFAGVLAEETKWLRTADDEEDNDD